VSPHRIIPRQSIFFGNAGTFLMISPAPFPSRRSHKFGIEDFFAFKLGCPPPLHAQALARGPLAAVRLHRTVGSGTDRAAVRCRRRRCCQRRRTPAASRRLPGQRQRQAPPTATRPPSFGIQAESGVPLGVFQLSGPAVPASPEVRHPYPARSKNSASFTSLRSTRPQSRTPPCAWR
jgi:hypothetical protein